MLPNFNPNSNYSINLKDLIKLDDITIDSKSGFGAEKSEKKFNIKTFINQSTHMGLKTTTHLWNWSGSF